MILIIAAMPEEYVELEKLMTNPINHTLNNVKYTSGTIDNKEVLLMLSGVGKVNAAYSLTTIISKYDVDFVINIGSAGGLCYNHQVEPLDVVIADKVCYHDVDITLAGRQYGELPDLPVYYQSSLTNDMIKEMDSNNIKYHVATIASGDQFVGIENIASLINDRFDNVCAIEMEAGAIAHICHLNSIDFVVFRSISDVVGQEKSNNMQFNEYIKLASKNSALAASLIIKHI